MQQTLALKDDGYEPEECTNEIDCYKQSLALLPPAAILRDDEPKLESLVKTFRMTNSRHTGSQIKMHLQAHWHQNLTLLHCEWTASENATITKDQAHRIFRRNCTM